MKSIKEIVALSPVIPVLTFNDVEEGINVCQALYDGGIKVFEITLRTDIALKVIEKMAQLENDMVIGAGTLINAQQCIDAKNAGAQFGVSPGFFSSINVAAKAANLPMLPGVMTPSDIIAAINEEFDIVKFFPAAAAGGIKMLRALNGPFPDLKFCPTGGITPETAPEFLALSNVVCVGGSWLAPKELIKTKNWDAITDLARKAMMFSN